ncbi:hypothetical protein BBJ29_003920 [Phytophthora kernoviae]|uniref:GOLD domain-containing protein n=1 Tax=Phytophthora kernoviae TaxID=325452 RepID=A0A421G2B9_9STRA|nr:hypothetical protein BBJ29_003920 [Phytophthora kernoviae]
MAATRSLLALLLLTLSAISLDAVQFEVKRKGEKCLSDEVAQGSLVVVHYNVIGGVRGQSNVALSITDPLRKFLKQDANIDTSSDDIHKFSFTADAGGNYAVCFANSNDKPVRVMMDFKHGVEAKDYTEVAKREHLMPVEKELRKMEDTVDEIHREMLYMREREAMMRNTNESTNSRVLWFSFFSIVVLLGMGVWQRVMSDFQGTTSSPSSDGERYAFDDDYEGGPDWETAPDNDDEDGGESDDNDAFSDPSRDHDPEDGKDDGKPHREGDGSDEDEADGDFEDAWLDDYLPGESAEASDDWRASLHHIEEIESQEESDTPGGAVRAEGHCTVKLCAVVISARMEKAQDASTTDQERLRNLNEKLQQMNEKMAQLNEKQLQLDTVERENRSLREETQNHEMQALSSNELIKTLRDQLALTSKSEEQLKLQTKQLMEQNQSLQSDLLEKIAAETTKFQKMARLSAENESLVEELERKENAVSDRELEQRQPEAKECVFSLSRAKNKLEEKLQASRDEAQRLTGELTESGSELQLVKHGFVTTVIRDAERAWIRTMLTQWRIQTHVSTVTKELRLQVEMAELKATERDKYSKSLDDYSRVLRSDLERFQFFSLDKRITVDVLSKKLLREEERYRHMEERHVALEEKAHALKSQLASFVEWDGLALPFSVLALCKDAAVTNLREIFLLHAAGNTGVVEEGGITKGMNGETPSPRLAMPSLVRLLEYSTLLEEKVIEREVIAERLTRHLPPYAVERGLLFADFITGLNQFLTEQKCP